MYPLVAPCWQYAGGALLSFLVYDVVLLPPFLGQFAVVRPDHLPTLIAYTAVLVYSALVAVYYLMSDPIWHATHG